MPTWQEPGISGTTSFKAALEANPSLRIDAFYLELPLHTDPVNFGRSIADDATDIQAAIEGGFDSKGQRGLGILTMTEFQGGKVVLVGYSQGAISSLCSNPAAPAGGCVAGQGRLRRRGARYQPGRRRCPPAAARARD